MLPCLRLLVSHFLGKVEYTSAYFFVFGRGTSQVAQGTYRLMVLVLRRIKVGQPHISAFGQVKMLAGKVDFGEAVYPEQVVRFGLHQFFVSRQRFVPAPQAEEALSHVAPSGHIVRELG